MYYSKEEQLAYEIAEQLKDTEAIPLYLSYTKKYSEEFLRSRLARVMAIPDTKIRRSRGALFTFLIEQHAKEKYHNSRY